MSVWNQLADGCNKESIEIRDILIDQTNKGFLFCPLSVPCIWELRKQAGISFKRTSELMEILSLNVTFRDINRIFDYEISHFLEYLLTDKITPLSINELFGSLLSYLIPEFELKFNVEKDKGNYDQLSEHFFNFLQSIALTDFMSIIGENSSPSPRSNPKYQNSNINRHMLAKGDNKKMKRIEQEVVTKEILIPRLNKQISMLSINQQLCITDKLSRLPKSKKYDSIIESVLTFLPAISACTQIFTVSGYDINRKDKENDFFDKEILIYGLSYSSVFVAIDRWIKDIIAIVNKDNDIQTCYMDNLAKLKDII